MAATATSPSAARISEGELLEVEAYLDNVEDGVAYRASRIKGPASPDWNADEDAKRHRNNERRRVCETVRRLIELARCAR